MGIKDIESTAVDIVAAVIPWLAPLAPAFMAYEHMTQILGYPWPLALAMALVIEALGLATIHTVFTFSDWQKTALKADLKAGGRPPIATAVGVYVFYLVIVLTVNVALDLDETPAVILARVLLSLLSVPAGVVIALRAGHVRRVEAAELAGQSRKRGRTRSDKTGHKRPPADIAPVTPAIATDKAEPSPVNLSDPAAVVALQTDELAKILQVSPRTARRRKEKARAALNGASVKE